MAPRLGYSARVLLCPEHEWCPLLTLLDASRSERADRTPRFRRPAHAYAQTTRRAARLQDNAARTDSHSGRAA